MNFELGTFLMDISIIIVNYNMKALVSACLDSLRAAPPELASEILLVDNNSGDGSCEHFAAAYPEAALIRNTDNAGFARACNQAARAARGEMLLFLNPDTEVPAGAL